MRVAHEESQARAQQLKKAAEAVDNSPAALMARAKEAFFENLKSSEDLEKNLKELVDFIQEQTQATGVYVGKLVFPSK